MAPAWNEAWRADETAYWSRRRLLPPDPPLRRGGDPHQIAERVDPALARKDETRTRIESVERRAGNAFDAAKANFFCGCELFVEKLLFLARSEEEVTVETREIAVDRFAPHV